MQRTGIQGSYLQMFQKRTERMQHSNGYCLMQRLNLKITTPSYTII